MTGELKRILLDGIRTYLESVSERGLDDIAKVEEYFENCQTAQENMNKHASLCGHRNDKIHADDETMYAVIADKQDDEIELDDYRENIRVIAYGIKHKWICLINKTILIEYVI